jgi:hypothetical protein
MIPLDSRKFASCQWKMWWSTEVVETCSPQQIFRFNFYNHITLLRRKHKRVIYDANFWTGWMTWEFALKQRYRSSVMPIPIAKMILGACPCWRFTVWCQFMFHTCTLGLPVRKIVILAADWKVGMSALLLKHSNFELHCKYVNLWRHPGQVSAIPPFAFKDSPLFKYYRSGWLQPRPPFVHLYKQIYSRHK